MAVKAKYTDPISVVETPEVRARIARIADREELSQAEVIRQIIRMALDEREIQSESS